MQLTSLLSILSAVGLTSTAMAASLPTRGQDPSSSHWHVSDFTTNCALGNCVYTFNIAGPGTTNTPSFNTTCSGSDLNTEYQHCLFPQISSTVAPLTDGSGDWNVTAQHFWVSGEGEFWAVGQANVKKDTKKFDVEVHDQYGVA